MTISFPYAASKIPEICFLTDPPTRRIPPMGGATEVAEQFGDGIRTPERWKVSRAPSWQPASIQIGRSNV